MNPLEWGPPLETLRGETSDLRPDSELPELVFEYTFLT